MYEASKTAFSDALFENPSREYRGAPFWSWNGRLRQEKLDEQLRVFQKMGFGGFHIHARIGLETEYLGAEFLSLVRHCNQYGDQLGLNTFLYDEDKWPSGAGGGRVTCDSQYACRYLLFSPNDYPDGFLDRRMVATSRLSKNGDIRRLMRYDVSVRNGRLERYRVLQDGETGENVWYAYLVVTEKLPWFNGQPYVDTLSEKAIEKFVEVTHERYLSAVGGEFSKTIPSIFTDEPSYHKQETLDRCETAQDVGIAYTDTMEAVYRRRYGESLLAHLPEIFWTLADGTISHVRYQYHDCAAQMFADAYSGTLGTWCEAHSLMLTGHVLFEAGLESQAQVVGEVMRALRPFSLPGIDMLADRHEYTTAKQAQSVSRQYGRPGVMSELYGVTNWDYDFRGHKHQGDWQAALGVTLRVPHLSWMSMGGEAKRDYPAPLDQHSPWYEKYSLMETYFARVNTALTRGRACCRIGVIHPIESMWMAMGPADETAGLRSRLDTHFSQVTEWLLFNLLDFDYISEALLPELYQDGGDGLRLGEMTYSAVVVPDLLTIRASTLRCLEALREKGGKVLFLGQVPSYVDGRKSNAAKEFASQCTAAGFDKDRMLEELEPYRELDIRDRSSQLRSQRLLSQLRTDGEERWLFIAQGKHDDRLQMNHWYTMTGREDMRVRVRGVYRARHYDALTGRITEQPVMHRDGWTYMDFGFYEHDSVLLRLTPTDVLCEAPLPEAPAASAAEQYLPANVDYRLSESNVLLLDQAEYRVDGGPWQPREELLRLDNAIRAGFGYPLRTESFPQPWLEPGKPTEHTLELRFRIDSEIALPSVDLAFEAQAEAALFWNGRPVARTHAGFYVDADIRRETLGALQPGENELLLRMPFGPGTNVEWCYLLGDFGVRLQGDRGAVTALPETVAFGDLTRQGFPFYGGNLEYACTVETGAGTVEIEIPEYYAALLHVELDGQSADVFAQPYAACFRNVAAGRHTLRILAYGTRINTFGQVHNCNRKEEYFGPKSWRTTGKNWTYLYQLRPTGVTLTPILRLGT